jgi:hypothetical protein
MGWSDPSLVSGSDDDDDDDDDDGGQTKGWDDVFLIPIVPT